MGPRARHFDRITATVPVKLEGGSTAETRNLSPGGIFFVTDAEMKSGSSIRFTLEFDTPSGKLFLDCTGEIVRVEQADGKIGVAAKILESRLERRSSYHSQGAHA